MTKLLSTPIGAIDPDEAVDDGFGVGVVGRAAGFEVGCPDLRLSIVFFGAIIGEVLG